MNDDYVMDTVIVYRYYCVQGRYNGGHGGTYLFNKHWLLHVSHGRFAIDQLHTAVNAGKTAAKVFGEQPNCKQHTDFLNSYC